MLKMAELIKTALNEVGCEELPSGCDDISVDPSFIENNISNTDQQPVSSNINPVASISSSFTLHVHLSKKTEFGGGLILLFTSFKLYI